MTRLYQLALRLLPLAVREQHGEQMAAVFEELLREVLRRSGWRGAARLTARELAALVRFAWCERRGRPAPRRIDERQFSWPIEPEGRSRMFASLAQDVRYAVRMLGRTPGFTLVCVATMALAIGANSAIFSVVNGVLLRPLPYPDADRIVVIGHRTDSGVLGSTTPGNFYDWRARTTAFDAMAAYAYTQRILMAGGPAERVLGVVAAGSLFDVLGRQPAVGRTLTEADDDPGAEPAVVLSHRRAQALFEEGTAVGRAIAIEGVVHTVVGVMPSDFAFPDSDAEYWVPARFAAAFKGNRDQYFLRAVARLRPGTTRAQAGAQLDTVMDAIRRDYPQHTQNAFAALMPMQDLLVGGVRTQLLLLLGAVVLILLIACANLGNLLLARAATRRREVAVRQALGARPGRLVRQLLTESVVLALAGGAAGLLLGYALLDALVGWLPDDLPRASGIGLDLTVLAFSAGASVAAGLAFGSIPALQLASRAPIDGVRDGARGSARASRVRTSLVAAEVALALVLLTGAGLLVRSFVKLLEVNPGFAPGGTLTFRVGVPASTYPGGEPRVAFFERFRQRLDALPGVREAAIVSYLPVTGYGTGAWFNQLDRPLPPDRTPPSVPYRVISPNFFQALGIPLRRGRLLTDRDHAEGTRAVVVSEAVARRFWPGDDPLGRRIYLGAPENRLFPDAEVVGIVGDVRQLSLDSDNGEAVYVTHRLMPSWSTFSFVVRTDVEPESLVSSVRAQLRELDPAVPIFAIQTMDDVLAQSRAPARSLMVLIALFAGVALVLAVIGVFGVLSYTVSQRTTELGIRLALGATSRQVQLLVLGRGMMPVLLGVGLGLLGALALTRLMRGLLFEVTPHDPATFAVVALTLIGVAALASYLPARRATLVDPVTALRSE